MFKTNDLIRNAIIAALYAALTISLAPLSYGPIQVRVSEFMTLLAFTNRKCLPGLVLGCFNAWHWVDKEGREIRKQEADDND